MKGRRGGSRILIYSHDTFGLGHLRRCRAIAHALVKRHPDISVLILSGSPIIGSFDFLSRVDFVRVPGVIKLRNGEYTPLNLRIDIEDTLAMRASIIEHTADIFDPDLFLVDKEPLGLRGEVRATLELLKSRGTPLVLGLRDVMDEPRLLAPEWERKNALPALDTLYDQIWVYGTEAICDPLAGLDLPASVRAKMTYTGYLRRARTKLQHWTLPDVEAPYILVTPGGGGDGDVLVDWVLRAYETDAASAAPVLTHSTLVVFGPFMHGDQQASFLERAARLDQVTAITFEAHMENLVAGAVGIVGMGGYNTFCEILSFDKPAIMVPRIEPRLEQFIRASRADELGLTRMLDPQTDDSAERMIQALVELPTMSPPSRAMAPGMLDGLDRVDELVQRAISGAATAYPSRQRA